MECNHKRFEEMRGTVFCTTCGLEIEKFFGFSRNVKEKPKSKLEKTMENYGFPTGVTKEAIRIYMRFYGKNPVRKMIIFGCFCVAWGRNEYEIRTKMKLQKKLAQNGLEDVLERIKNYCR